MNRRKQTWITAFALFSLFFGAGNTILPPYLGYQSGDSWWLAGFGFAISAVLIPILAIYGYARIQKSLLGFAALLGRIPALLFGTIIYAIAISLPFPRTASVTYEMAVAPFFEISSLGFSTLYFGLVLVVALNRSKILDIIGKYLTPLIGILLVSIILVGLFIDGSGAGLNTLANPVAYGFVEGYQTFDAIGGVVVGGVIVLSLTLHQSVPYNETRKIVARAGLLAGLALLVLYIGLIALGSHFGGAAIETRSELLSFLSVQTLGSFGATALALLVGLACFTTAVGIVVGMADFISELWGNSKKAFVIGIWIGCLVGVLVGQFSVAIIIKAAIPALLIIYPITIVLILLNALPNRYHTPYFFRIGALAALVFSLPDFIRTFTSISWIETIRAHMPLSQDNLSWLFPTCCVLLIVGFYVKWNNFNQGWEPN